MFKKWLLILFISIAFQNGYCQLIYPSNKNFIVVDNKVWDLKSDSSLAVFNIITKKRDLEKLKTAFKIECLRRDGKGNIFASTSAGRLMKLNKTTLLWEDTTPANFKKGFDFAIDHKNVCFQLVAEGLLDTKSGKIYTPGKEFAQSEMRLRGGAFSGWEKKEKNFLIDRNNILWFSVDYGEWGSDLYSFNTVTRKFIKEAGMYATGAILEADGGVYCTGNGATDKPFIQFSVYCRLVLDTLRKAFTEQIIYNTLNNAGHESMMKSQRSLYPDDYIGTAAFNKADGKIYFFCPFGLYKGNPKQSLTDISKWVKVENFKLRRRDVKPRIHHYMTILKESIDTQDDYDRTQPYAIRYMNFTDDGQLVFTSYHDGLGIFDGREITILEKSLPGE